MRDISCDYPDYSAELAKLKELGTITDQGPDLSLLNRIISRHIRNADHMRQLYGRYKIEENNVPIFQRIPRFKDEGNNDEINNQINNDFFSEIVDVKVGYFAGKPANYTYGTDYQSAEETGGETAVEEAQKCLSDFVKRNNMFNIDMETTKFASICGYAGRLFYVDGNGDIRVMVVPPYETIILYSTEMMEPEFAIRYYKYLDLNDSISYKVEFYDSKNIYYYEGQLNAFRFTRRELHLFDYCPLQGVPNNLELMGDAEKVLTIIDDYDGAYSDNSNDIESFANAYMVFNNCRLSGDSGDFTRSGVIEVEPDDPNQAYNVTYLTKNIDGSFVQNHLDRAEDNIYRFSKTPNLNDPEFNAASGIALKIKMTGLETKAGAFEAKQLGAATYMFKLIASAVSKRKVPFDPLQCSVQYNRNFPTDFVGDAQAVQALIAAGLPKQIAFKALSFVNDIDYVMRLIEEEQDGIPALEDEEDIEETGTGEEMDVQEQEGEINE